ncbi:MAG TPA: SDR family oxidoreductase [Spirochaetia bacterium]|nr:SDR family oxidoreductase [Spirochaetia bacterium]
MGRREAPGSGRVALVTGASSGIGRAAAAALASSGWRVFGAARHAPAGPGRPDGAGGPSTVPFLVLDVRDGDSVRACVSQVESAAGHIDLLVNCAGVVTGGPAEEMLAEEVSDQLDTNLLGTIRMCQAVLPGMRRQRHGRIINVGSLAGLMGLPFQAAYSASKHGIEGFSESLQIEVRRFGITVIVVDPGDIATEITQNRAVSRGSGPDSPYRAELERAMRAQAEGEAHGWSVDRCARVIVRIAQARSPRFRYTPGPFVEWLSPRARRLIPDRLFQRFLAGFYGMSGGRRP